MNKRSAEGAPPSAWSAKQYKQRRKLNKLAKISRKKNR